MSHHFFVAESLDGFIADRNGSVDWPNDIPPAPEGEDEYAMFIARVDGIVMGRKTFETVHNFDVWPYDRPVFVLSRSMAKLPAGCAGKASATSEDIGLLVDRLGREGLGRLYVDGGQVIQGFLDRDMIDEMVITRVPVLLGGGVRLFGNLAKPLSFEHVGTKPLHAGLTMSTYRRTR